MLQENPALQNVKVFGTDGEKSLSLAFCTCFGMAHHLLCDIHMHDNIRRKLTKLGITGQQARHYLNEIFGRDMPNSHKKGPVDFSSEGELQRELEKLKESWLNRHVNGEQFLQYFLKHKAMEIAHCI